jgi:hypothetical protein
MHKRFFVGVFLGVIFVFFTFPIRTTAEQKMGDIATQESIERGEYLVRFGGCNDCHTPKASTPNGPVPDKTRLFSGYPSESKMPEIDFSLVESGKWILFTQDLTGTVGPWGVTFASNLTPDDQTGIGLWTEDLFIKTMRTGKHLGAGPPILPPMPWFNLEHLTDEDLKAMFAYLQTLKPIRNLVPAPISPSELNSR